MQTYGNPNLCTVHPKKACCEEAIACIDFEPKTSVCNACQKGR
ncbi:hypothetical protein [Nostoc sp.]